MPPPLPSPPPENFNCTLRGFLCFHDVLETLSENQLNCFGDIEHNFWSEREREGGGESILLPGPIRATFSYRNQSQLCVQNDIIKMSHQILWSSTQANNKNPEKRGDLLVDMVSSWGHKSFQDNLQINSWNKCDFFKDTQQVPGRREADIWVPEGNYSFLVPGDFSFFGSNHVHSIFPYDSSSLSLIYYTYFLD